MGNRGPWRDAGHDRETLLLLLPADLSRADHSERAGGPRLDRSATGQEREKHGVGDYRLVPCRTRPMMTFMGRSYRRLPLRYSPHPWRWLGFTALLPALAIAQSQNRAFTETHTLRARWELADSLRNGNFLITPYKPVYVLPAVWSSTPNRDPRRTNGPDPTGNEELPLDVVECKFQFSFKT